MFNEYASDIFFFTVVVLAPFFIIFIDSNESGFRWWHKIKNRYFSISFQKAHGVIYVVWGFFSWYGGQADYLFAYHGDWAAFIGATLGSIIGIYLFSLLLTYIFMLIKPLLKKLHDFVNKQ